MIARLLNPVVLMLASMCIQWVVLVSMGQYSVKLPYSALALVIVYAATGMRRLRACLFMVRQNWMWMLPFVLYLILLTAALYSSPAHSAGTRQLFYLVGCIAFAGCIAAAPNAAGILRAGAGLSVLTFVVVVEFTARKIGLSWVDAIREFVLSGNLHFVVYSFLRPVFNSLSPDGDLEFVASQKNVIAVCLLVAGLLFRGASAKASRDIVGMVLLGGVLFLLLMLNTRSVLIVAGVSVVLAIALQAAAKPAGSQHVMVLKGLGAALACVLAVGLSDQSALSDTMSDRFAFEDASSESRVLQYEVAIERISESPILGSGFYKVDGYPIHNLFLSAWMNAGIAAFLLVVTFYLFMVGRWISFLWKLVKDPRHWLLPIAPEWIAPLPILPFFRVWISGDGGNLFLGEWIAVAAFLGLLLANDLKRFATQAQSSPEVGTGRLAHARGFGLRTNAGRS